MALILVFFVLMQQVPPSPVTVAEGAYSAIMDPREATARTAGEWRALWKLHGGSEPAPAIDFGKEMVAAVFLGTRATGGFSVQVLSSQREADALVVEYAERAPGPGAIVTQALTSPFHIVTLPQYSGPIRFRRLARVGSGR